MIELKHLPISSVQKQIIRDKFVLIKPISITRDHSSLQKMNSKVDVFKITK